MSGAEAPFLVATLITSTAATVYSTVSAGKAQKAESKRVETASRIEARGREIERTKRLNAYMATINAQAGAGGVNAGVGSLANLQSVAKRENQLSISSDRANASAVQQGARSQAKYAKRASLVNSAGAVADSVNSYQTFKAISEG